MTKKDLLEVGLKLVGTYLGVLGLSLCAATLSQLVFQLLAASRDDESPMYDIGGPFHLSALAHPAVYLLSAYLLIWRTRWFVNSITRNETDDD